MILRRGMIALCVGLCLVLGGAASESMDDPDFPLLEEIADVMTLGKSEQAIVSTVTMTAEPTEESALAATQEPAVTAAPAAAPELSDAPDSESTTDPFLIVTRIQTEEPESEITPGPERAAQSSGSGEEAEIAKLLNSEEPMLSEEAMTEKEQEEQSALLSTEAPESSAETQDTILETTEEIPEPGSEEIEITESEEMEEPEELEAPEPDSDAIWLNLISRGETSFTNALQHYVYFDAEVQNAESLTMRLYSPEGKQTVFRTRYHVDRDAKAVNQWTYTLKSGQELYEDLNIQFRSDTAPGTWVIEVTATAADLDPVTQRMEVEVSVLVLKMEGLGKARAMLIGLNDSNPVSVQTGKIRFVAQNPKDARFVKEYWFSKGYDLRTKANAMCTRAVFSMALSYLGIDCTPVGMSDMMKNANLYYTYDEVCDKLGNVTRITGDLETLWAKYQAGEASPVLLHFKYTGGGMHAVLLISRDEENPHLFYGVTSSTTVNTVEFGDGRNRDVIIPIIIEKGEEGQQIQSPLLAKYNKGRIDQLWSWARR